MVEDLKILSRRGKTIPNKKPLSEQLSKSIIMLFFTLLGIIVIASALFLYDSTQNFQKGYELELEQLKKDDLLEQQELLTNKTIDLQTTNSFMSHPLLKSMVKPTEVIYLTN